MFLLKRIKTKKVCGTQTSLADDELTVQYASRIAKLNDKPVSVFRKKPVN